MAYANPDQKRSKNRACAANRRARERLRTQLEDEAKAERRRAWKREYQRNYITEYMRSYRAKRKAREAAGEAPAAAPAAPARACKGCGPQPPEAFYQGGRGRCRACHREEMRLLRACKGAIYNESRRLRRRLKKEKTGNG